MRIKMMLAVAATVASLTVTSSSYAQIAEEIWSADFCEQAVALAKQRGEPPEVTNLNCMGQKDLPESYWRCVNNAMRADASLSLNRARQGCQYQE